MDVLKGARWRSIVWWVGTAGLAVVWAGLLAVQPDVTGKPFGVDAMAYHSAPLEDPYGGPQVGLPGAYLYPPPFIQILAPLRLLPWDVFIGVWLALQLAGLAWLLSPGIALVTLAVPFVLAEVAIGNIHLFMAIAIVKGIGYPAAWSFIALTKPTVAVVGAWHVFRGEWRDAGVALGVTVGIIAGSAILSPELWLGWLDRMQAAGGTAGPAWMVFLAARLALASLIVWLAAWRRRPMLLPIAAFLALPITWPEGLTLLAAMPRLALQGDRVQT